MMNYHDNAIKALTEEYRVRFTKVITRYCTCKREYERRSELLYLIDIRDKIEKCIEDRTPCDLGKVSVNVVKKLFRADVYVMLGNKRLSLDEFENLLITLGSFMEWYRNDCSLDAVMAPLIGADYFDEIKGFIEDNLNVLDKVCENSPVDINGLKEDIKRRLPGYVVQGFINALSDVLHTAKKAVEKT